MTQEVKLRRVKCNYQAENSRFLLDCDFSKQYSHYYNKRLEKTKPFVEFNCRLKWPSSIPILKLTELASVIEGSSQIIDGVLSHCDSQDSKQKSTPEASTSQPLQAEDDPGSAVKSYFKFSKRLRKFSQSSPGPKSSTQKTNNDSPIIINRESKCAISTPQPSITSSKQHQLDHINLISPITPALVNVKQEQSELEPATGEAEEASDLIIVGTIFKRMRLQPDVVQELSEGDFHINCERYLGHYSSQDDRLVLEDADETISLVGNIDASKFVTGIVVAVLGYPEAEGSQFHVKDICYAEPNQYLLYEIEEGDLVNCSRLSNISKPSIDRPLIQKPITPTKDEKLVTKYLLVVSGFGFNQDMEKQSLITRALQNMIDFIWGGGKFSEDERSSQVARILVVGDCLSENRFEIDEETSSQKENLAVKMKMSRQVKPFTSSLLAVKHMDDFFAQLSKTINVDIMPGPSDPSSHLMPQQPFHPCMFPKSCMFPTFNCTTNPHYAIYDDKIEVLATSGQNIDIISKFSALSDPMDIMKCHLKWGNSAPSAPDNLYSVPYEDDDPYVIDFIPDIYIAGCQDYYRHDYYYYSNNELLIEEDDYDQSQDKDGVQNLKFENNTNKSSQEKPVVCGNKLRGNMHELNQGQQQSQSKKDRTLLLTVPKFHETFSCVLINLNTLEPQLMHFNK